MDYLDYMQKQIITISVPANLIYSSLIRHIADEVFGLALFEKAWCSRLKLIVDELFMNAVRYGSTENVSLVHATFMYDENEIRFTIEDDGTGKQSVPADELQNIIQRNEMNKDFTRTSGRGLSMITKVWADDMQITKSEHGGIAVTIAKKIESTTPPPPLPPTGLVKQAMERAETILQPTNTQAVQDADHSKTTAEGPLYEIRLAGEIDQSNIDETAAPVLDKLRTMPDGSRLVLDFADVSYINSTFIGHLASWYTLMHKKRGSVSVKNMNKQVTEVLELVGLLNVIELTK
jgi:anti-anti-sigma factor